MSVMRWFRKNNKKLLLVIAVVLMVAFGLPTVLFRGGGRQGGDETVATYRLASGESVELTEQDFQMAYVQLQAISGVRLPQLQAQLLVSGQPNPLAGLQDVGMPTIWGTHMLVFADDPMVGQLRQMFRQQLTSQVREGEWAQDEAVRERLIAAVEGLTGAEPWRGPVYWLVLADEARRAGIRPAHGEVEGLLTQLRQVHGNIRGSDLVKMSGLRTEAQLAEALRNYLAIIRYADSVSRVLDFSENELKRAVRERIEQEYVEGEYVQFSAGAYVSEIDDPGIEELESFFAKYKVYQAGEVTADNPFGLGYRLEDRIQADYLQVSLADARAAVEAELAAMGLLEREARIEQEWQEDRERFVGQLKQQQEQREQQAGQEGPKEWTEAELAALEQQARLRWEQGQTWQQRLAQERGEQVLRRALELARQQRAQAEPGSGPVDLEQIAQQLSTPEVPVTYGRSPYLDREAMGRYKDWGQAYPQTALAGRTASLPETLFAAKPLRDRPVDRSEGRVLDMYDLVGPAVANGWSGENNAFLVRIVGVDESREPASLSDDGGAGSEPVEGPVEESELYRRVVQDWKRLQAMEIAQGKAGALVERIGELGWEEAIAAHNEEAAGWDPNDGGVRPMTLSPQRLADQRDRLDRVREMAMRSGASEWAQQQIEQITTLLDKAAELAVRQEPPVVIEREDIFSVAVFGELETIVPGQQDYVQRRPLVAQELSQQSRTWAVVLHYAPDQIADRLGLKWANEGSASNEER